jgi:PhnB protein
MAPRALAWYVAAFDATELMRLPAPDGRIAHAEVKIGDSHVMLADEAPEHDARAPAAFGGSPVTLHLYVPDADATMAAAVAAGAEVKSPLEDKFYGDRMGSLRDPFGHTWHISTHIEDVAQDEVERRMAKLFDKA